jgi:hypothetical protein
MRKIQLPSGCGYIIMYDLTVALSEARKYSWGEIGGIPPRKLLEAI